MASFYSEPPIKPFKQPEATSSRPQQTLYTLSKADQERLNPYLPPQRTTFLPEGPLRPPLPSPTYQQSHLPHVTLTYAQSLDSQISLRSGTRTTLSGTETKAMTQFLRTRHDAILIGAGTANADNPGLNTSFSHDGERIVRLDQQPRPLILDPGRSWEEERCGKMFDYAEMGMGRAPWWIIGENTTANNEAERKRYEERAVKIRAVGGDVIKAGKYGDRHEGVDWYTILRRLRDSGIRSVMIEGGAIVINDLLRARNQHLVSSVIVTIAPTYLGTGGVIVGPPRSVQDQNEARLKDVAWVPFGQDVVIAGRLESRS